MSRRKPKIKNTNCPNCDYKFPEINNFCPNCGQDNHSHKIPVGHYILEFLESTIHFDTKFFQTFKQLFLKPGQLTKDYNNNIRARYVPPIRLYIFISFIFFLVLSLLPTKIELKNQQNEMQANTPKLSINVQKLSTSELSVLEQLELTDERLDSIISSKGNAPNWSNKRALKTSILLHTGKLTIEEYVHRFYKAVSIIIFILMPIFALFLYILNYRKKLFYVEHLSFSLHFHSLALLILLIFQIISRLFPFQLGFIACVLLGLFTYLLLSIKNAYSLNWRKAIIKTILLGSFYFVTVAIFIGLAFFTTLLE